MSVGEFRLYWFIFYGSDMLSTSLAVTKQLYMKL